MRSVRKVTGWQFAFLLLIFSAFPLAGYGQKRPSSRAVNADGTIPALLVSDIHFDPLHDPAKLRQLTNAPVSEWTSILSAPPSPGQQQAFSQLQDTCHARGVDTPYELLRSSLQAMGAQQPDAAFMTVSGDLLVHAFSCRYKTLLPASTQGDFEAFALKTLSFVIGELRTAFPGSPIYAALGNNDTACGDYRLDTGSDFLRQTGKIIAEGLPASKRLQEMKEFATGGYYSVTMAPPMRNTRMIVINDIFLSPNYSTCSGKADPTASATEMAWLQNELARAERLGQRVWVMGHIPPGVDPYSTVLRLKNVCKGEPPVMFLSSDKLTDLLVEHGGAIRLAIFAHTHMDEMRMLAPTGRDQHASAGRGTAIKLVPSISPVDGNNPSFTVARIDPATAILQDYQVIAASNQTGVGASWAQEYDYAQTYHEAQFSSATVKKLVVELEADRGAKTDAAQQYIRNYFVGDVSAVLKPFWPQYVCSIANDTAKSYAACVCSTGK